MVKLECVQATTEAVFTDGTFNANAPITRQDAWVNLEMKKGKNVVATLYNPEKGILKNTTV